MVVYFVDTFHFSYSLIYIICWNALIAYTFLNTDVLENYLSPPIRRISHFRNIFLKSLQINSRFPL